MSVITGTTRSVDRVQTSITSNVTGRHRGPKFRFGLVTERRHYNARPIYVSGFYVAQVLFFIVECGIVRFLCAMCALCVYSTLWHHHHPLRYLRAKFRFCRAIHCLEKNRILSQSLTHSITQLIYVPWTEAFTSE